MDDVVYDMAEGIARRRAGSGPDAPVEIVVSDIEEAARNVMDALREHFKGGSQDAIEGEVEMMQRCFEAKAKSLRG
jgi:hypothetical protein